MKKPKQYKLLNLPDLSDRAAIEARRPYYIAFFNGTVCHVEIQRVVLMNRWRLDDAPIPMPCCRLAAFWQGHDIWQSEPIGYS